MRYINDFLENFFVLSNAMSIYILFGVLFAGFLKEILPEDFISKHLGKSNFLSVLKATLFGIPMPVCSCSVVPLAKSLQKEGASRGAVQSFLISTPITGVDSIFATYSFFGWFFTLYRVVTSVFIAIFTGLLQNIITKEEKKRSLWSTEKSKSAQCCKSSCCSSKKVKDNKAVRVFRYAFDTLFKDMAKSLLIGLVIGALFTTFLPKELISDFAQNRILTYLLVLAISMPLYVCATSSLPIGASLLFSGVPVGAVFVFLSAGPATNSVTMSVVKDMFGKKSFFIYLFSISLWSIFFGYILDFFMVDLGSYNIANISEQTGILNYIATITMLFLMAYYIWREK